MTPVAKGFRVHGLEGAESKRLKASGEIQPSGRHPGF